MRCKASQRGRQAKLVLRVFSDSARAASVGAWRHSAPTPPGLVATVIQSDGKIVVVGLGTDNFTIARYLGQ